MTENPAAELIRLGDTDLTVTDPAEDVRGRKVLDRNGEHVGDVDDILIDTEERRARFLQVGSGGFLGIGEQKRLVPVDAVTAVEDEVRIDTTQEQVAESAAYDPDLTRERAYYENLYGYYGYVPYWGPGYTTPGYPYH